MLFITHPFGLLNPLHGFVKKSGREILKITLDKDYGHSLRAIFCFSRPDFPQNPCSTEVFRTMGYKPTVDLHHNLASSLSDGRLLTGPKEPYNSILSCYFNCLMGRGTLEMHPNIFAPA